MTLAAGCGLISFITMEVFSSQLLQLMGASDVMMPHALVYLRIRAVASPAVMVMCVCQVTAAPTPSLCGFTERERERERERTWWAHTGGGNALAFKQPT
jgi:hypothetical protein